MIKKLFILMEKKMTKEELFEKVRDIIADQTGEDADKISMDTDIKK
ncbi:hypothetical protein Q757_03475 [Oenococcus alcoholitolerans]|uniref:Uncharacterized protein n=1 Tax=Oenococcus alcoholitolerans TaxID=931074 RepID=A0ABR4XRD6_9LACO|nr:hypothetical protein Q757_03475 [Oenococcus alcoholitolerans]